jgi:Eco57I restriction-modification methylase
MPLHRSRTKQYLDRCDFESLFIEELGWDKGDSLKLPLTIGTENFSVRSIAEKRGFTVFDCEVLELPDRSMSMKIDRQLTEYSRSHILIFSTQSKSEQVWMWVRQEPGKPIAPKFERYRTGTSSEILIQKLNSLVIAFEEEEKTTLTTVTQKVKKAFDIEKVTKKFFQRFEKEHQAFLGFISGIEAEFDRTWYASLMLNRLMFVYFIQKKGFLDGNSDYLRDRLKKCQAEQGTDEFYSFYRIILLRLFHEGLGKSARNKDLEQLIGKVPYLNGGLFEVHQLEEKYTTIQIPDAAFTKIFDFFDEYQWHLDDRPLRREDEINPDVLGYIFEKYINQKQMGAYYTKEDITEYISKNTIIPFLFDAAAQECAVAFQPDGAVWALLKENPNRYIYEAVRKGVDESLPAEIEAGIAAVAQREGWNRPATAEYALPTETWREHIARRQRCLDLRAKLAHGEVTSINDLITHNLDIRQFAQDVIASCEGTDLLRAFYQAISQVSVLDPTCGSGAFLFAALNILEPLYTACLERMQGFVEDEDTVNTVKGKEKTSYEDFRHILAEMASHHNQRYFILKSIILNNLYGVDIMEEATEICKLRLFLKLVSQVEVQPNVDNFGLEPLPDIDFNIRSGNSLVGYVSLDEISKAIFSDEGRIGNTKNSNKKTKKGHQGNLFQFQQSGDVINKAGIVDTAFQNFRKMQTSSGLKSEEFKQAKQNLRVKLKELNDELNYYLAREYRVDIEDETALAKWQSSHRPFHWFVDFYKIISEGGFDVIIGNPPYVEYKDVKDYKVINFQTIESGDLYAYTTERSYSLLIKNGYVGLIIPISIFCTDGFESLQKLSIEKLSSIWVSCFANRPSQLFDGAQKRLTILIGNYNDLKSKLFTTSYLRWFRDERSPLLDSRIEYGQTNDYFKIFKTSLEKSGNSLGISAFNKLISKKECLSQAIVKESSNQIFYTRKFGYFLAFLDFIPEITEIATNQSKLPSELKILNLNSSESTKITIAALTSSTFFWFWQIISDCRNLNRRDLLAFPLNPNSLTVDTKNSLNRLGSEYLDALRLNSRQMTKSGLCIQTFNYSECKSIIDEIDRVLAQHYGFTDEELDFIINYDIKYRMGRDSGGEE